MNRSEKTKGMVQLALFAAIIIIMAAVPSLGYIPLGVTRATILHVPVIIGAIIMGPKKGAALGALFGLTSLLNNTFNPTATSFVFSPFYSVGDIHGSGWSLVTCFVPRILIGVVAYYVYAGVKKLLHRFRPGAADTVALALGGVAGSLTNAVLVMACIYLFFAKSYAAVSGGDVSKLYLALLTVIGVNGVPEAIVAAVLTLAVCKALNHRN